MVEIAGVDDEAKKLGTNDHGADDTITSILIRILLAQLPLGFYYEYHNARVEL